MVDIGISDAVSHRSRKVPRELFDLRGRDGPVATSPPRPVARLDRIMR